MTMGKLSVEANIDMIDVKVTLSHLWKGHLVALKYSSKLPLMERREAMAKLPVEANIVNRG